MVALASSVARCDPAPEPTPQQGAVIENDLVDAGGHDAPLVAVGAPITFREPAAYTGIALTCSASSGESSLSVSAKRRPSGGAILPATS